MQRIRSKYLESSMSIINLMEELQYPSNEEGVCKGIALMAQRARWAGQFDPFQTRMAYLNSLKPTQLQALLQSAKEHDKNLRQQKTTIPLSQDEQILLTVESFFFQIWAHFSPRDTQKYLNLDHGDYFNQLDTYKIEQVMYDKDSEDKLISPLPHPNRYLFAVSNQNCQPLKSFLEKVKEYDELSPGCVISSGNHDIHVFYNLQKNKWVLTNHDAILEFESIDEVTAEIIYAFKKRKLSEDVVHICINVYTDEKLEKTTSFANELTHISDKAFAIHLDQTPDINQADAYGNTLLHIAAAYGFADKVSQLAKRGDIDLNKLNDIKFSALILAILFGQADVVNELLEYPMDKVALMHQSLSALGFAASQSRVEIVDLLIKKLGIPQTHLEELNPLGCAVLNNRHDIVKRLLQEPGIKKSTILAYALFKKSDIETINILLNHPHIGLNSVYMSQGALHIAADRGDIALVSALLARDKEIIPVNDENYLFWMPAEQFIKPAYHANTIYLSASGEYKVYNIHGEIRTGKIETGTMDLSDLRPYRFVMITSPETNPPQAENGHIYLSHEGEYTVCDHHGTIFSGKLTDDYVSYLNLKELTEKINEPIFQAQLTYLLSKEGRTKIHAILDNPTIKSQIFSAIYSAEGIVSFIDVNLDGPQYDKPINIAAQKGHLNIVRELLKHPDIDLNYRRGLSKPTLLTEMVRSKTAESVLTFKLILQHPKIDVNLGDDVGMNPLCTAVLYGNIHAVKALLEHPALNVNLGNPLEIAIREGHYDILKALIQHPKTEINCLMSNGLLPLVYTAQFAWNNSRYDKYMQVFLSKESSFFPADPSQLYDIDQYWKNYYQVQPLIECIQKCIASINQYQNSYSKLIILDKEPEKNELDNQTIAVVNKNNEWIIYRQEGGTIHASVVDKNHLDMDRVKSIDNKLQNKIYRNHELINYILCQCSVPTINAIEWLEMDLYDFISDLKQIEYDKESMASAVDNFCTRAMHIANSSSNCNQSLLFTGPRFDSQFNQAKLQCHQRIERFNEKLQASPASS